MLGSSALTSGAKRFSAPSERNSSFSSAPHASPRISRRSSAFIAAASKQQHPESTSSLGQDWKDWASRVGAGALAFVQVAALSGLLQASQPVLPAHAVLNSPNAQIARTPEAALRRAIPAFNPDLAAMQKQLEDLAYLLRIPQRKPWGSMAADVSGALAILENRSGVLSGVPADKSAEGQALADSLYTKLKKLELAVSTQQPDFVSLRAADSLKTIGELEILQAPGLAYGLPQQYKDKTRLVGRATVDMVVEKKDGSLSFVDTKVGGLVKQAHITLTLDGYSAPLTAGNFAANVQDGLYNDRAIDSNYTSLLVPVQPSSSRPPLPLEILPLGEYDPVYRVPLDVQGGELPVLPLSISGALAMTHLPGSESFVNGEEWFIYKFDRKQAGLAGLAFDEGSFGVFGYVTEGLEVLNKLSSGDVIVSATLTSGADKLVREVEDPK